jgi:molybdate transport system substrate-binding protein
MPPVVERRAADSHAKSRFRTATEPAFFIAHFSYRAAMYSRCPFFFAVVLCMFFCMPCYASPQAEITVSAAISLKNAFGEIGTSFETQNQGIKVLFNFGGSGDLARQIEAGAPVDVFASASPKDMNDLEQRNLLAPGTRAVFAGNSIVIVQPSQTSLKLACMEDLKKPAVRKIGIGNPQTVPAGRYAGEVLAFYKLGDALKEKIILGENVRQVLDYVVRGEIDAGIVYKTDALTQPAGAKIVFDVPQATHSPVLYPAAVIKNTKNLEPAKRFVRFVASDAASRQILEKYGFLLP